MYIRKIVFKTLFDCCYEGLAQLGEYDRKAIHRTEYNKKFRIKPVDDLDIWADKIMNKVAKTNTKISCKELGKNMYPCDFSFDIILLNEEYIEEEIFVTGVTYRTLRMAARGKAHIYGLSDTEFHKRMSERREHYDKKQADELLKLFKEGLVKTKAKI